MGFPANYRISRAEKRHHKTRGRERGRNWKGSYKCKSPHSFSLSLPLWFQLSFLRFYRTTQTILFSLSLSPSLSSFTISFLFDRMKKPTRALFLFLPFLLPILPFIHSLISIQKKQIWRTQIKTETVLKTRPPNGSLEPITEPEFGISAFCFSILSYCFFIAFALSFCYRLKTLSHKHM